MYGKTYLGVILSYFVSDDARRVAGAQIKISSSASVSRAAAAPEA